MYVDCCSVYDISLGTTSASSLDLAWRSLLQNSAAILFNIVSQASTITIKCDWHHREEEL